MVICDKFLLKIIVLLLRILIIMFVFAFDEFILNC